jgi:hypothetical protein
VPGAISTPDAATEVTAARAAAREYVPVALAVTDETLVSEAAAGAICRPVAVTDAVATRAADWK